MGEVKISKEDRDYLDAILRAIAEIHDREKEEKFKNEILESVIRYRDTMLK